MMVVWCVLGVILYIIIGIIISGFMNATNFVFSEDAIVMVAIFWPMLLVALGLYYCVIGPYRLGEYIRHKIEDRKSR